jgi:hypothetical protein
MTINWPTSMTAFACLSFYNEYHHNPLLKLMELNRVENYIHARILETRMLKA